jgi:hypothetical protein
MWEKLSHYLLHIQQVKISHIICFTNYRWKTVTLFALQMAGEKLSNYLLYIQQVKISHIIEIQCGHCDYWLHWWIGLRLFMEFAQDATWWFSPLHRMSPDKGVFVCSVYQHLISLMGGKKDLVSAKYWKSMLSLWLWIPLMDRVKVIHGVCTGCHLMVFTPS